MLIVQYVMIVGHNALAILLAEKQTGTQLLLLIGWIHDVHCDLTLHLVIITSPIRANLYSPVVFYYFVFYKFYYCDIVLIFVTVSM